MTLINIGLTRGDIRKLKAKDSSNKLGTWELQKISSQNLFVSFCHDADWNCVTLGVIVEHSNPCTFVSSLYLNSLDKCNMVETKQQGIKFCKKTIILLISVKIIKAFGACSDL